jgi:hypothetical protein
VIFSFFKFSGTLLPGTHQLVEALEAQKLGIPLREGEEWRGGRFSTHVICCLGAGLWPLNVPSLLDPTAAQQWLLGSHFTQGSRS